MATTPPRDLSRRQVRRRARGIHRTRAPYSPDVVLFGYAMHTREGEGDTRTLLGIDTPQAARHGGLSAVLPYLQGGVVVVTPAGVVPEVLRGPEWIRRRVDPLPPTFDDLGVTAVLTLGRHQAVGDALHAWARTRDIPSMVLQDDVLTPLSASPPPDTTVLAWTAEDGDELRRGRDDVEVRVVGSQRLWQAAHGAPRPVASLEETPVVLGQLAVPELPRRVTLAAARAAATGSGALYRPGLGETDRLSVAVHAALEKRGVELQDPETRIAEQRRGVVTVLSADVLEAAVRGLPAWVHAPHAPRWIRERWEHYGMQQIGSDPTSAPDFAPDEPARLIAQLLES